MAEPRPDEERARVEELRADGLSCRAISKVTGIPLGTVADWSRQLSPDRKATTMRIVADDVDAAVAQLAGVTELAVETLADVATNGVKDSDRVRAAAVLLQAFPLWQNQQVVSGRIADIVGGIREDNQADPFALPDGGGDARRDGGTEEA